MNRASTARRIAGWIFALIALGYAALVYDGIAVAPEGDAIGVWQPSGFLLDTDTVWEWSVDTDEEGRRLLWSPGIAWFGIPAVLLAVAVFLLTPSAIPRALAFSAMFAVPLLVFYGLTGARQIWEFFHWRASVVMLGSAAAIGCTLASPSLARSWLRQNGWVRVALYLPVFVALVTLVRHATGTDEHLPFNFSPWPAIPVLALEIGAYTILGVLFGVGLALSGLAARERMPSYTVAACVAGLLTPALWFVGRFGTGNLGVPIVLSLIAAAAFGLALLHRGGQRETAARATAILVGAFLVFAPLATGRALATGDYVANKFVHSQQIIDALARYYEQSDSGYPETLDALVEQGYLDAIPTPRLGFELFYHLGWLDRFEFFYQSLGSSYVLEFTATEWVQCGYNPPWEDEEEYEDDDEELEYWEVEEDDESGEAWNCPDERPELW